MNFQITTLSSNALNVQLLALRKEEREVTLNILFHLAEVEARKLHLEMGYPSLFSFCVRKLGYSESSANRRIYAARALAKFPVVGEYLKLGRVTLWGVATVASILTADNVAAVLESIAGKTQEEIKVYLSATRPRALPVREVFRPMGVVRATEGASALLFSSPKDCRKTEGNSSYRHDEVSSQASSPVAVAKSVVEERVVEERFEVRFSVCGETKRKLERAQVLLSGRYPRGLSLEGLFGVLLDNLLESKERKVRCSNVTLRRGEASLRSRHIPAAVRRAVFERDGGCCTFVGNGDVRCGSRWDVEVDHVVPVAQGGDNTPGNLRLLCRNHNMLAADKSFGREYMRQFVAQ